MLAWYIENAIVAGELAQWVEVLAATPDELQSWHPHGRSRESTHKSFSRLPYVHHDMYMLAHARVHTHTYTHPLIICSVCISGN